MTVFLARSRCSRKLFILPLFARPREDVQRVISNTTALCDAELPVSEMLSDVVCYHLDRIHLAVMSWDQGGSGRGLSSTAFVVPGTKNP